MALRWSELSASKAFQSLDETGREKVRQGFFQDRVAPLARDEAHLSQLRQRFDADTLPKPATAPASVQRPDANLPAPPKGEPGFVGGLKDFARGAAAGTVGTLPQAAAGLADYADAPKFDAQGRSLGDNGSLSQWARKATQAADERAAPFAESDLGQRRREADPFSVRGAAYEAGRMLPLSAGGMLAGAAGGFLLGGPAGAAVGATAGAIGSLPLFFGLQAKDTYDRVAAETRAKNPNLTDEQVHDEAMKAGGMTGAVEAGGELLADLVGLKLLRLMPSGVKQGLVRSATKAIQGPRQMIADAIKLVGAEVGTELAQGTAQAEIEQAYGVGEGATWDNQKGVIVPTMLMSLVQGGASVGMSAAQRYRTARLLADPKYGPERRSEAANTIAEAIGREDPELGGLFLSHAREQIARNRAVVFEDDKFYRDLKPLERRANEKALDAGEGLAGAPPSPARDAPAPASAPPTQAAPVEPPAGDTPDPDAEIDFGSLDLSTEAGAQAFRDSQEAARQAAIPVAGTLEATNPITGQRIPAAGSENPPTPSAEPTPPVEGQAGTESLPPAPADTQPATATTPAASASGAAIPPSVVTPPPDDDERAGSLKARQAEAKTAVDIARQQLKAAQQSGDEKAIKAARTAVDGAVRQLLSIRAPQPSAANPPEAETSAATQVPAVPPEQAKALEDIQGRIAAATESLAKSIEAGDTVAQADWNAEIEALNANISRVQAGKLPERTPSERRAAHAELLKTMEARKRKEELVRQRRSINRADDDILTIIGKLGGIKREALGGEVDEAHFKRDKGKGRSGEFAWNRKTGGRELDEMTEALSEEGLLPWGSTGNDTLRLIHRALGGERIGHDEYLTKQALQDEQDRYEPQDELPGFGDEPTGSSAPPPDWLAGDEPTAAPEPAPEPEPPTQLPAKQPTGLRVTFGGKTYPVKSVEDAAAKWDTYRDRIVAETGASAAEIGNGVEVTDSDGNVVARVSFNGRIWDEKTNPMPPNPLDAEPEPEPPAAFTMDEASDAAAQHNKSGKYAFSKTPDRTRAFALGAHGHEVEFGNSLESDELRSAWEAGSKWAAGRPGFMTQDEREGMASRIGKDAEAPQQPIPEGSKAQKMWESTDGPYARHDMLVQVGLAQKKDAGVLWHNAARGGREWKKVPDSIKRALIAHFDAAPTDAVTAAANEAATSPANDLPEPTDGQKEAGNYKKGHATWNGLGITIENPAGSHRRPEWPALTAHYGYIKRTTGADGDHVDVFLNPAEDRSDKVVVIDQLKGGQKGAAFDEHKVMLGFKNKAAAVTAYKGSFTKGWYVGDATEMSVDDFKVWLEKGDLKKPAADSAHDIIEAERERENQEAIAEHDGSVLEVGGGRVRLEHDYGWQTVAIDPWFDPISHTGFRSWLPTRPNEKALAEKAAEKRKEDESRTRLGKGNRDSFIGARSSGDYALESFWLGAIDLKRRLLETAREAYDLAASMPNPWAGDRITKVSDAKFSEMQKEVVSRIKAIDAVLENPSPKNITALIDLTREAKGNGHPPSIVIEQPDAAAAKLSELLGGETKPAPVESNAPEHAAVGVDDRELGQIVQEFNDAQASMLDAEFQVHHLFDPPAKNEVVRLADKVKADQIERVDGGGQAWLTPAQAKARIAEWKAHAAAQKGKSENWTKVVLSLFDLTGKWAEPWEKAGYQVYRFDIQDNDMIDITDPNTGEVSTINMGDINNFSVQYFADIFGGFDGNDVYAILAACPCTDFAVSGARHFAAKDADGRTVASVRLVHQTLAAIEYFKPPVWAIENPVGRIEKLGGLPPWRLSFDPNHLGEPYTKKTLIWGRFNADLPIAPVAPTEGSKMHSQYGGSSLATKNARSATPEGFSYGFFMANNAIDHPVMAVAGKYDRLDRDLIAKALAAGATPQQIDEAVQDAYYQELNDEAANDALRELIENPTEEEPSPPPRAKGPIEVRVFASGMSRPADLKAAFAADNHVGVDVGQLSKQAVEDIARGLIDTQAHVFVDSGAFSLFRANLRAKQRHMPLFDDIEPEWKALDFDAVLRGYNDIVEAIVRLDPDNDTAASRLHFVAPDVVGNQEESLKVLRDHAQAVRDIGLTSNVIVPLQAGNRSLIEMFDEVDEILGSPYFTVGIPANAEAAPNDQVQALLKERGANIEGVHFLGAGSRATLAPRMEAVIASGYDGPISGDSNRLRAFLRGGTKRAEALRAALADMNAPEKPAATDFDAMFDELVGEAPEPVPSLYGDGAPLKGAERQESLDGFKVGDRVSVEGRTIGDATIEMLFTRPLAGFREPAHEARIVNDEGKRIDVITEMLTRIEQPAKPDRAAGIVVEPGNTEGKWLVGEPRKDGTRQWLAEFSLNAAGKPTRIKHFFEAQSTRDLALAGIARWEVSRGEQAEPQAPKQAKDELAPPTLDEIRAKSRLTPSMVSVIARHKSVVALLDASTGEIHFAANLPRGFVVTDLKGAKEFVAGEFKEKGLLNRHAWDDSATRAKFRKAFAKAIELVGQKDWRTVPEREGWSVALIGNERGGMESGEWKSGAAWWALGKGDPKQVMNRIGSFVTREAALAARDVAIARGLGPDDQLDGDQFREIFGATYPERWDNSEPTPKPRSATKSLGSAVKNAASGVDNALQGLVELFGGTKRLNMGLGFDEQTYAKAKPLFLQALKDFENAAADLRAAMNAIIAKLRGLGLDQDGVKRMKPYVVRFMQDFESAGSLEAMESPAETPAEAPVEAQPADPYAGKWFATKDKAFAFIAKKNLGRTHVVVPANGRFEIQRKDSAGPTAYTPPVDDLFANTEQESSDATRPLDQPGPAALEGAPADEVRAPQEGGRAGVRSPRGGRADGGGNQRPDGAGIRSGAGLGDDAGAVPVPAGGGGAGSVRGGGNADSGLLADGEAGPVGGSPVAGGTGSGGSDGAPADKPGAVEPPQLPPDFTITDELDLGGGGQKTKFRRNAAAIRLLNQLEAENRFATPDEQRTLALYVGWGGLPQAFDADNADWKNEYSELRELLSDEEYEAARQSTQYAHYTSREIVSGIYDALASMGFTGGKVLEAGGGVGNFIGLMPEAMRTAGRFTLVERERIAAGIAKHLYPRQNVQMADFTEFGRGEDGFFDAVIGNPPFSSTRLTDKSGRKHLTGLSIHNFFIAKSIDLLRSGGILANVVSNSFMDAQDERARQYIGERARLLGAIRLPNNAFSKNAGTEVTTDIVFFQKLPESEWGSRAAKQMAKEWAEVKKMADAKGGEPIDTNPYFIANPGMMLGQWGRFGSMYRADSPALVAWPDQDTAAMLAAAVKKLPKDVYQSVAEANANRLQNATIVALGDPTVSEGGHYVKDGKLYRRVPDQGGEGFAIELTPDMQWTEKQTLGKQRFDRLVALAGLRKTLRALLAAELSDDPKMEALRKRLNTEYDALAKDTLINDKAVVRIFEDDPDFPLLASLELDYKPGVSKDAAKKQGIAPHKSTAKKAAIFTRRMLEARQPVTKADSPQDALNISLAERGVIDLDYIGALLGQDAEETLQSMTGGENPLLFTDPATREYVLRDDYLSGNVRRKLKQAKQAGMMSNARALERVLPADIGAGEISARIGSPWIPTSVYEAFAKFLLGDGTTANLRYVPIDSSFSGFIDAGSPVAQSTTYGTPRMGASEILFKMLNSREIKVVDYDRDGKASTNKEETENARDKAREIKDKFQDWLFADTERSEVLVRAYNDANNNYVTRVYDGSWLSFPGKVPDSVIRFRRHQRNFVARVLQARTALADHVVGAGKTFAAIAAAVELKRLGLARKPMIAVPNHLVKQWAADFYRLYPGANVLAATKDDFARTNRRRFLAKIATGDWDAVIVAHSSFGFIKPEPTFEAKLLKEQIADIEAAIAEADAADGKKDKRRIKQLEQRKERLENRIARLRDKPMDDLLDFAELGVDQLFVDEAHLFKNLMFTTAKQNIRGLGDPTGSQRAIDMYIKVRQVFERNGRGQGVVFLTGTPVSNSLAEMYHMMRFLMPEQMKEAGFTSFDAWANTYADIEDTLKPTTSGTSYKTVTAFGGFTNTFELLKMFDQVSDTVTMDDIKAAYREENNGKEFPLPPLKGGKRQPIAMEMSEAQREYMADIGRRADALEQRKGPPKKGEDNHLTVMSDARKVAMDVRLVRHDITEREKGGRIDRAASEIMDRYQKYAKVKGTQLVFSDLGTPLKTVKKELKEYNELLDRINKGANEETKQLAELGNEDAMETVADAERAAEELEEKGKDWLDSIQAAIRGFSVYDDLRAALIERGVPPHEIAFIHDYNTDEQKSDLFRKVNAGEIRILMGSTPKLGAGTNVQERLVALHHLDIPWKPSDVEQREGRIIRQGNKLATGDEAIPGFEVEILAYVTKDTLDKNMWDIQERKIRGINQLRSRQISREIENSFDEMEMSASEMQAAATGNLDLLTEIQLRNEIQKLERRRRAFDAQRADLAARIKRGRELIETLPRAVERAEKLDAAAVAYRDELESSADTFSVEIEGKTYTNARAAGSVLAEFVEKKDENGKPIPLSVTMNGEVYSSRAKLTEAFAELRGDLEPVRWEFNGKTYKRRSVLAKAIEPAVAEAIAEGQWQKIGNIGDFAVTVVSSPGKEGSIEIDLKIALPSGAGVSTGWTYSPDKVGEGELAGVIARAIGTAAPNMVKDQVGEAAMYRRTLADAKRSLADAEATEMPETWPDQARLDKLRAEHRATIERIKAGGWKPPKGWDMPKEEAGAAGVYGFYSRGQAPAHGHTEAALYARLRTIFGERFIKSLLGTGKFKIASRRDAEAIAGDGGADVRGFFNPADGTTYLIADSIPEGFTDDQLRGLMRHEIGIHALKAGRDSAGWQAIVSELQRLHAAGDAATVAAYKRAQAADAPAESLWEETAGYLVESAPEAGIVRRILTWLKNQVLKLTGFQMKLTDADLVAMAQAALKRAPEALAEKSKTNFQKTVSDPFDRSISPAYSQPAPLWVSTLAQRVAEQGDKTRTAADWKAWLLGNAAKLGIKKDEIEWSGITDYLEARGKDKVSAAEVAAWVSENGVQVQEVMYGSGGRDQEAAIRDLDRLTVEADALGYTFDRRTFEDGDAEFNRVIQMVHRATGQEYTYDYGGDSLEADDPTESAPEGRIQDVARQIAGLSREEADGMDEDGTRYGNYKLPGGENYTELLLTLPQRDNPALAEEEDALYKKLSEKYGENTGNWPANHSDVIRVRQLSSQIAAENNAKRFHSNHWNEPNILAHVRFDTRTDADGRRVLFIEEIQSDWAQQGRKEGFGEIDTGERRVPFDPTGQNQFAESVPVFRNGPPAAPFVTDTKAWTALALKRMIRYAADNGFDAIAWTTGKQQADRYRLSKVASFVGWVPHASGGKFVTIGLPGSGPATLVVDKEGAVTSARGSLDQEARGKTLADVVGKELAVRIMREETGDLDNQELDIGGEGMRAFYDGIVPQVARELVKKMGGGQLGSLDISETRKTYVISKPGTKYLLAETQVGRADKPIAYFETRAEAKAALADILESNKQHQPGFLLTDQMREKAAQGMPLFSRAPKGMQAVWTPVNRANEGVNVISRALGNGKWEYMGADGVWESDPKQIFKRKQGFASLDEARARIPEARRAGGNVLLFSRAPAGDEWGAPVPSRLDTLIYRLQDKHIDLKRVQEAIKQARGEIADGFNAYLKEELFHGRAAARVDAFLERELDPLIAEMRVRGVTQEELGRYLWARHAPEANAYIATINPELPDGGSGMTDAEAAAYMDGLTPEQRANYAALAARVDRITEGTRTMLERYRLISATDREKWESKYQHYVPLFRADMDTMLHGMGTGQGYSVRGKEAKRRTGSELPVVDILGNIANARERAVTRGEKARVGRALYALAKTNPNPEVWKTDVVPMLTVIKRVPAELDDATAEHYAAMLASNDLADADAMAEMPPGKKWREVVTKVPDPNYKNRENIVIVKLPTKDGRIVERAIVFNERNERAMRMAHAVKNLDGQDLGELLSATAQVTRYFASINTQYNPIFGVVNLIRDVQTAALNLSSTPLAGRQGEVMATTAKILGSALKSGMRNVGPAWAELAEEFEQAGGMTGYREMFRTGKERTEAIQKALDPDWWMSRPWGKALTAKGYLAKPADLLVDKGVRPILDWLSDYNRTMENAVRLAVYKTARDSGLSVEQAASLGKNISVNFNRKGEMGAQLGALYAFFNAAVQGIARMGATFAGPAGRYIIGGGVLLGAMQALLLAAAGYDDDEPPQFVRERNLIMPAPWSKDRYLTLPMPLGFNVLPNLGRLLVEALAGGEPKEKAAAMMGVLADAFNPLGGSAPVAQILAPTAADPLVALSMNEDWTGKPIAREDFSRLRPTPGYLRARDTSSSAATAMAWALNRLSGGTDFKQGIVSPTPDQIEYLLGQLTGGIGREALKAATTVEALATGEDLPAYKVPLVGRFYGETAGAAPQANRFYSNVRRVNEHQAELKGLRAERRYTEAMEYARENPEARAYKLLSKTARRVNELRERKRKAIAAGAGREQVEAIDRQIKEALARANARVEAMEG